MTKGVRIAGSIITFISGCVLLIIVIVDYSSIFHVEMLPEWFAEGAFALITGSLGIAGAILLFLDKNYGAILPIVAACYFLIIGYVMWAYIWLGNPMYSVVPLLYWPFNFFLLVGGILGLAAGSEK